MEEVQIHSVVANLSDVSPVENSFNLTAKLTEQTILDLHDVTVKAQSLETKDHAADQDSSSDQTNLTSPSKIARPYVGLNITIENKSPYRIKVGAENIAINNVTINSLSSSSILWSSAGTVEPGETRDACIKLADLNMLNLAGITDVATIVLTIMVDESSVGAAFTANDVVLETSLGKSYEYDQKIPDRGGTILYNENGIKIACLGMDRDNLYSFDEPGFILFVQNITSDPIKLNIRSEDTAINNVSVSSIWVDSLANWRINDIMPDTYAYTSVKISDKVLSKLGIQATENIKAMDFVFVITNSYDGRTVVITPKVTLNFK